MVPYVCKKILSDGPVIDNGITNDTKSPFVRTIFLISIAERRGARGGVGAAASCEHTIGVDASQVPAEHLIERGGAIEHTPHVRD